MTAPPLGASSGLRSLLRGGALTFGGSVGQGALKLIAAAVVARTGGAAIQGGLGIALACMSFGAILLSLGLDYANGYMTGRDRTRINDIVANTFAVAAIGIPVAIVWTALYGHLFPVMVLPTGGERALTIILLIALCATTTAVSQSLQSVIVGLQRYDVFAVGNLLNGGVWLCGVAIVGGGSYERLLVCWLISTLASIAVYRLAISRVEPAPGHIDSRLLRESIAFGVRTLPASCFRALNFRLGLYLVALYLAPTDVGVYTFALAIAESMLYLPSALSFVVLGGTINRTVGAADVGRVSAAIGAVGLMVSAVAFVAGGPALVMLGGPAYAAGGVPLAILLMASTFHSIGALRLHRFVGLGQPSAATWAQGLTALIVAATGIWLIPRHGLVGAATSAASGYLMYVVVLFAIPQRSTSDETSLAVGTSARGAGAP